MSKNGNGHKFDQKEFNDYIVDRSIIGFPENPIRLSSGRMSPYYIDWKFIMGDAYSMKNLVTYVTSFAKSKDLGPRGFIGVKEGGSPLGLSATAAWAEAQDDYSKSRYPLIMERGTPKEGHGDPKYKNFVGGNPRGDYVIIEDVTTTGDSAMKQINSVKEAGGNVLALISLTDRLERRDDGRSTEDFFKENGIKYYPMSNSFDLIQKAYKNRQDGPVFKDRVEEYFNTYGVRKLNLGKVPHMNAGGLPDEPG